MTDSMTDFEKAKLEVARYELEYRRDKQWKIFSWIATILVAVISGIAALGEKWVSIDNWQRAVMTLAILIITRYSVVWIDNNFGYETKSMNKINSYLNEEEPETDQRAFWPGYNPTIAILSVGAVVAIWASELVFILQKAHLYK